MGAVRVGAVELRRGCESGGSGNNYFGSAAAFAASLKLDSSHRGLGQAWKAVRSRSITCLTESP